jgi:hypothetical protein
MLKQIHQFQQQETTYYLGESLLQLGNHVDRYRAVLVIDENVEYHHGHHLRDWKKIVVTAGEEVKNMDTVEKIIDGLISFEADRKTTLVGIGGGMLTDVAGFAASIYMRGIPFGFVPRCFHRRQEWHKPWQTEKPAGNYPSAGVYPVRLQPATHYAGRRMAQRLCRDHQVHQVCLYHGCRTV